MGIRARILCLVVAMAACVGGADCAFAQCEPTVDCNANGVLDFCDIAFGTSDDCNTNGVPDECDIALNAVIDCNLNGIPDTCEPAADTPLSVASGIGGGAGTAVATDGESAVSGFPNPVNAGIDSGAAVVHRRVGTRWIEANFLLAPDASPNDLFGSAVDVDGEWLAVGAPGANISVQEAAGAVYLYRKVAGTWTIFQKLSASVPAADDLFGGSVSLSGSNLVIGAPQGVGGLGGGRALIYSFDGIQWVPTLDLTPAVLLDGDLFGFSVSIDGPRAFVGAPSEQGLALNNSGTIYAYQNVSGVWLLIARIISPSEQQNEHFGEAVSVSGTRVAVGAPGRDNNAGGVHILSQAALAWSPEAIVSSPTAPDVFGEQISLHQDALMVGDNRANANSGLAHIFDRDGGSWTLRESRVPASTLVGDRFGSAVSMSTRTAIVGARGVPGMFVLWVANPLDCNLNGIEDICDINVGIAPDCNLNGVPDSCDIAAGTVADCDLDGIPDSCELALGIETDCNANGVLDTCDILAGAPDCNLNSVPDDCDSDCDNSGTPDQCDIALGSALDCNENGIPDSCDVALALAPDCNGNGIPDSCDLTSGFSQDCDLDGALDDCAIAQGDVADCNGNEVPDSCDIVAGTSQDCNGTGTLDECDIATALSEDCDGNTIPDECDFVAGAPDCNANGILDACDLLAGSSGDCDGNTVPDECDFANGALDCNANGILDTCDVNAGVTVDATGPTITGLPGPTIVTAEPGLCGASFSWADPIIEDNCQIASTSQSRTSGEFFLVGVTTVTYIATDIYGNGTAGTFTVTVRDLEAPTTVGAPTDQLLSAQLGSCAQLASFALPVANDNCSVLSISSSHPSGGLFPVGDTLVEITTLDPSGNATIDSFTITVLDLEDPQIAGNSGDIQLPNDPGVCGAIASWIAPTSSDNCPGEALTASAVPGTLFPIGTTTVTYTATDASGNAISTSFNVTVDDTENPQLAGLPGSQSVSNDPGVCGAQVFWREPTATDNCPLVTLSGDATSGDLFPIGTTTVAYTAADATGNSVSGSFDVTVADSENPSLTGTPTDLTLNTDLGACGATLSWAEPTASDNCLGVTLTSNLPPRALLAIGATVVTYTATDAVGNSVSESFTVTVIDNEPPTLSDPPVDLILPSETGVCGAVATWLPPVPSDPCGVSGFTESALPGALFPVGVTQVDYSVSDPSGNTATASFTVTVTDTEAPSWSGVPTDIVASNAPGQCAATVPWTEPTASDPCGVTQSSGDAVPGDLFPLGTTVVTYSATDAAGNIGEASFSVTVEDTEAPVLTGMPTNISLSNEPGVCGATALWSEPTALDNCANVSVSADIPSGSFFTVGTTTVTYTATDASGTQTPATFTVTVVDLENPVFTSVPAEVIVDNDPGLCSGTATWTGALASDNCGALAVEASPPSGSSFPVGSTTVTLTATDTSGGVATTTFTVTVVDAEAPQLTNLPTAVAIGTDPLACTAVVAFATPTANDNCAVLTVESSHASGSSFPVGVTTVDFTATDAAGNSTTESFTVSVSDQEAPELVPSADIFAPLDSVACGALVTVPAPSVVDRCGVDSVTNDFTGTDDASGNYPAGVTVVTWTATDAGGNEATATQTITVDAGEDCNANGFPDACDIADGTSSDCNENGVPDDCDVLAGTSLDIDSDGIPDDCQALFIRGDSNGDDLIDIADGIFILIYLFSSGSEGSCADSLDANDDGAIELSDAITVVAYIFSGGSPPAAPFETCGIDPTEDLIECALGSCP